MNRVIAFSVLILLLTGCMTTEPSGSYAGRTAQVCAAGQPFYGSAEPWAWGLRATLSNDSVVNLPTDTAICRDIGTIPANVRLAYGKFTRRGNVTQAWIQIGSDSLSWLASAVAGSW